MADDVEEPRLDAHPNSTSGQNDKLYAAEGILDPRKRRAEKKRRKAEKTSHMNDMDADYDFKVDYRMKDVGSDLNNSVEEEDEEEDEVPDYVPMPGDEEDDD